MSVGSTRKTIRKLRAQEKLGEEGTNFWGEGRQTRTQGKTKKEESAKWESKREWGENMSKKTKRKGPSKIGL